MINLIDWKVKLAAVVFALAALFGYHTYKVKIAVHEAVTEISVQNAKETLRLVDKAQQQTYALRDAQELSKKEHDAKVKALNARVSTLTASLQSRPERPSGDLSRSASNPESPQGTSGLGLYRQDSEFLVGEATKAVELQEWLKMCYRDYDSIRATLDKFRRDNASGN